MTEPAEPTEPAAVTPPAELADAFTTRSGTVATFDDHVGAGTIAEADRPPWFFHCTTLTDGTRTIAVGTAVTFQARPGPVGLEATAVTPRPGR